VKKERKRSQLKAATIIGKKVLILGEVGTGKTSLIAQLTEELMRFFKASEITLIDMAPEAIGEVGGKLSAYSPLIRKLKYLSPAKIYAPRVTGASPRQVVEFAKRNKKAIDPLLDEFLRHPTEILIVNDITLYLHVGDLDKIVSCARLAETFLASAYYGVKLKEDHGTGISSRERQLVEKLQIYMDRVVNLSLS